MCECMAAYLADPCHTGVCAFVQAVAASALPLASTRLEPAGAAALQARAPALALLVAALEALPSPAPPAERRAGPGADSPPGSPALGGPQSEEDSGVGAIDAALAAVALAPPGGEALALRALSCALRPGVHLAALRRAAGAAMAAIAAGGGGLAQAARCSALPAAEQEVRARLACMTCGLPCTVASFLFTARLQPRPFHSSACVRSGDFLVPGIPSRRVL